ncbi:hypothetical protein BCR32DRAFT_288041 [Anaeromyces robustus]|uniref:Uncharacterized protein n=1 Tax=Anaeromyces robustus TaxID=1754192 RepID=A0A1Y1VM46_9FUNG|nr:hypothetical protein BCR32DRAFT_288041 [Anaeromyces robustus]|eukprot:ORX59839.1 hypothetical protein BCR32DRAFT_288041 [Anaeromyces robustus]
MLNESNISPTSGPNGLKFRYVVALEQSFPMSIKSKRSGGNLQYLPSYRYFSSDYFYYNLKGKSRIRTSDIYDKGRSSYR